MAGKKIKKDFDEIVEAMFEGKFFHETERKEKSLERENSIGKESFSIGNIPIGKDKFHWKNLLINLRFPIYEQASL